MNVSIQHAAKFAINLGKQLTAVIDIGECLEELGSLEQSLVEAERHAAEAKSQREEAEQEHRQVAHDLAVAQKALKQTQDDDTNMRQDAERFAMDKVRRAEEEAANTRKAAVDYAAEIVEVADAEVEAANKASANLGEKIYAQQAELADARDQMIALKESLG